MMWIVAWLLCLAISLQISKADLAGTQTNLTPAVLEVNYNSSLHPRQPYILAESTSGLSNRLRVLAAYMYVGEFKFKSKLVFIWDYTDACPGIYIRTLKLSRCGSCYGHLDFRAFSTALPAN